MDKNSGWPGGLFLPNPTADKVVEFMSQYLALYGIPKRIRTDPENAFRSEKFREFCQENFISRKMCPIRVRRRIGKVERMIRTLNERLGTEKEIVQTKKIWALSRIFLPYDQEKKERIGNPFLNDT